MMLPAIRSSLLILRAKTVKIGKMKETTKIDKMRRHHSIKNINIDLFLKISSNLIQWFDFTRPLKNWSKSSNKISGKTINFLAMVDNKQNEAKPYRKRPTIGFFPLDAFLCYHRMISVNAKKRRWGLEKAGDVYSHPVMLKARRWCLQLPSMFIITAEVSPPRLERTCKLYSQIAIIANFEPLAWFWSDFFCWIRIH